MRNNVRRDYEIGKQNWQQVLANSPNPEATKKIMIGVVIAVMLFVCIPIIFSFFSLGSDEKNSRYIKTDANVAMTETTMEGGEVVNIVYVNYFGEEQFYDMKRLNDFSGAVNIGDEITIYYDKESPEKIYYKCPEAEDDSGFSFDASFFIRLLMVVLAVGTGIFVLKKVICANDEKKKLMETGVRIDATVEDIVIHSANPNTGAPRYIIYCTYKDTFTGVIHRFKSDFIEGVNPGLTHPEGAIIPVYIMPNKYNNYYVYYPQNDMNVQDFS